ncbi:MAG: LacI family DNA-binding transcriptional regulator [Oscillospiraceae bacterium]|nr:LacI family DNA-binding transcriptional regulator [Oscillospiraceae bacterium]
MVSLKDIANVCGVSVATVSKALNDQPDIGEETKTKIRAVADELGYLTNSAARALKTKRTYNLGVLFVDEGSRGLTHEFFAALLNSFKVEAEQEGYDITFINNHNIGGKPATYLQHCLYRGVDGVLLACVDFYNDQVVEIISSSLPVVTIDHIFNGKASVLSDNISGMETLVRYACSRGHRKIAYIYGEPTAVTENRKIGFFRACEEYGIRVPDAYLIEGEYYEPEICYQITSKLLALADRPTCILFPDDFSISGGVRAIIEKGLHIPDDISVIGYDGILLSQLMNPKITTLHQDTYRLGTEAAKKLIELIEHPKTALLDRIIVPGELLPGGSVSQLV